MKTYSLKAGDIDKKWYVIDATDLVLGRLAAMVATYLRGKHKPTYSPHLDCGDNIIIINAEKVFLSGKKLDNRVGKKYYWHTGYLGGIKETTAVKIMSGKFKERIVMYAIKRMLGKGPLGRQHLSNLHIYQGAEHPHAGQQPVALDISAMNIKNKKR